MSAVDELESISKDELQAFYEICGNLVRHHGCYYSKCLGRVARFAF